MNRLVRSLFIFVYAAVLSSSSEHGSDSSIVFVILSQPAEYDTNLAISLQQSLLQQAEDSNLTIRAFISHIDFKEVNGAWAVFPLFKSLKNKLEGSHTDWIFILEHSTQVDLMALNEYFKNFDPAESHFIGRALYDERPTIIHHFYGYDRPKDDRFPYPDLAGGIAISWTLFDKVLEPSTEKRLSDFSIDAKHELSRMFFDKTETSLKDESRFCLLANESDCITRFVEPNYESCGARITNKDVFFAVKTFSGYYKTRIVVVKRTWAMTAKYVEYMSDSVDHYIPTIDLGVNNTERGHCEKTLAILKHFLSHDEMTDVKWLAVVDDDTLLSVPRLYRLLSCYSPQTKMVIGERYGYGFNANGQYGYAYPTGGAGMIFSRSAVEQFVRSCHCPNIDSPDDMIIGMCARSLNMPIIHSAAFHQARSIDYSALYLQRISPISFHKFDDIDPYQVYVQRLHEEGTKPASRPHSEL